MLQITILSDSPIYLKPRAFRIFNILKKHFSLSVINAIDIKQQEFLDFENLDFENSKILTYQKDKTKAQRSDFENAQILNFCKNGEFDKLIFTPNRMKIFELLEELDSQNPAQNLLIVEDITLLPFALDYKNKHKCTPKILIDLREFYPLEYDNSAQWLDTFGRFFTFLCAKYLPQADYALCVSQSILERYKKEFGIKGELYLSLPPYYEQNVQKNAPELNPPFKILYHGFVSRDRDSENLLELARLLQISSPQKFTIFAMVLSNDPPFLQDLQAKARNLQNLKFLPPVPLQQIVTFSTQFDIGLIPFAPKTYNLAHCMPNKFFEYIQAGLCVLSTPLVEIAQFLQKYKCGFCSDDFGARSLANALQDLDCEKIHSFKLKAREVAKTYNAQQNERKILKILKNLRI